ncbi:MAG TPA: hypothetical protein VFL91_08605 [Thermomicrobiales bacterium]|nr:hypothetical protein [Thermomicrobiales bacterium]
MEEETTGHFLITEEHDADDQPVYRVVGRGPEAGPPDVFATREDAEQWVAAWPLVHGVGRAADRGEEEP